MLSDSPFFAPLISTVSVSLCIVVVEGMTSDSRVLSAQVLHMAKGSMLFGSFTFRRPTRGLDRNGYAFGSKQSQAARKVSDASGS